MKLFKICIGNHQGLKLPTAIGYWYLSKD